MSRVALAVAVVLLCITPLRAESNDVPHVTVYGTAITEVVPDRMGWRIQVQNKGKELAVVAEGHTQIVHRVLALLRSQKLPPEQLQTSRMAFGENWEYRNGNRIRQGYYASTDIAFRLEDFEKYNAIWIGLAGVKEVEVVNVSYDHSNRIAVQNETRQRALQAARDKAAAMAQALNSEVGHPLWIEEEQVSAFPSLFNSVDNDIRPVSADEAEFGEPGGVAPGKIPIRVKVQAAFRLVVSED